MSDERLCREERIHLPEAISGESRSLRETPK